MSWNKNTIKSDKIDIIVEVLEDLTKLFYIPYIIEVWGKVKARGQSDHYLGIEEYELRKLTYSTFVIMEQMVRDDDCDVNDVIVTRKFHKDNVPEDLELERNDNRLEEDDIQLEIKDGNE